MRAQLLAMAVAYAFPLMPAYSPQAQWEQTEWPHGYHRNPFLARGPLTLAQHGLRLAVQGDRLTIQPAVPPRGRMADYSGA